MLEHNTVILSVPESTIHGATEAAMVAVDLRAVHKLLLADIAQLALFKEVPGFDQAG